MNSILHPPDVSDTIISTYSNINSNLSYLSFEKKPSYTQFILPAVLISYGVIAQNCNFLKKFDRSTHKEVERHFTKTTHIDDFLLFVPITAVYGLDFSGLAKAKHNFRDRAIVTATTYIIVGATVVTLKKTINRTRPDGTDRASFPSGHTASTFAGAHILFKEYEDTSPWIGIAGYATATLTGTLRVINKKHWVSDVVTGAGIGIISAELGYLLLPVFQNILGIENKNKNFAIAPIINKNNYGIGLSYQF
ncbi:MAG: phosphatase PAP2 family protein [Dysgonomonas sp.]